MGELTENVTLSCPDYLSLLSGGIWSQFCKKQWTDMVIGGDGYELGVHRIIFSIFSNNFTYISNETTSHVKLERVSIERDDLTTILEFAYKGEINVVKSRLEKVKEGAELLGFQLLVDTINNHQFNEVHVKTRNKRKLKNGKATPKKTRRGANQPSSSGLSLRKKNPVNYLEEEEEDFDDELPSDLPLLENAILIELEDDDDDDDDIDEEDGFDYEPGIFLPKNDIVKQKLKFADIRDNKSTLECGNCEFASNDWEVLRKHYQSNHSKHSACTYSCTECSFKCHKKLLLSRHMYKEHSKDRPFKCEKCDYRGKTMSSLRSHSEMHSAEKFTCSVCDQKFTLSCSLNRHMKLHISSEKKNACHLCTSKYRRMWDLKVHLRQVHNIDLPTTSKSFPVPVRVKQKLACSLCEYKTWEQVRFNNHMAIRHHLDSQGNKLEPKHKCELCEFVCFTKSQLSAHSDRVHSVKTFNCPECDYISPRKCDLSQHMLRRHSDKKLFMCETCGFLCATQRYLARHQETHQGNEFICGVCNMKFTLKSSLRRHGKMHMTDEKPFACHLCSYSSRKRYNLKCHLKRIHKVDLDMKKGDEQLVYEVL